METIPSWYIVASEDQALNPELERFYAKRIGATTTEIKSSQVHGHSGTTLLFC